MITDPQRQKSALEAAAARHHVLGERKADALRRSCDMTAEEQAAAYMIYTAAKHAMDELDERVRSRRQVEAAEKTKAEFERTEQERSLAEREGEGEGAG